MHPNASVGKPRNVSFELTCTPKSLGTAHLPADVSPKEDSG